jgi:hypothetical protein
MNAPVNPENERIRAQAILRSFTDQQAAVELFAPKSSDAEPAELAAQADRKTGQFVMRVFKALKSNRRVTANEPVQPPAYAPRRVTTSG